MIARDGWLALFIAAAVAGDLSLLPILCVVILPAWLLVSALPEFRIKPPVEPAAPADKPVPQSRGPHSGGVIAGSPLRAQEETPSCRSQERVSVAPTGVDPVTSRFSVVRSTN